MPEQLLFSLDFDGGQDTPSQGNAGTAPRNLRRAVIRWLLDREAPSAVATGVATRIARFRADVAAFWSRPVRNVYEEGPCQILTPYRTAIVQCYLRREDCWPDCSRSQELVQKLREQRAQMALVEEKIRREEPQLREGNSLFEEYAEWRYERSANREYHQLRQSVERSQHALYHGTKFERIRSACMADLLYLAVPANLVMPEELADGWGLLWVQDDLSVLVAMDPKPKECIPSNRLHLVQNVAAAATRAVLFATGIQHTGDGKTTLVRPPRLRRTPDRSSLAG